MPVSSDFAYYVALRLVRDEPDPWSSWKVAPLTVDASGIAKDALYDPAWEAFAPKSIGSWSVQPYVAPGVPPPPTEVLPYAYLASPLDAWANVGDQAVVVQTVAVIAWNATASRHELLFWEPLAPAVTVQPGDTFRITDLRFRLAELSG